MTASSPVPIFARRNTCGVAISLPTLSLSRVRYTPSGFAQQRRLFENKRIADMAEIWGVPMATHNAQAR